MEEFGIRHTKTPKYYHQANPTKRYNRTIKQIIKAYLENDLGTWDDNIENLQFAINTSKNASIQYTIEILQMESTSQPETCQLGRERESVIRRVRLSVSNAVHVDKGRKNFPSSLSPALTEFPD